MTDLANEVQARRIADQVAEAAVERYAQLHPPAPPKAEIPAPLKWAGGILASLMALAASGGMVWGVTTLNELQITVARMDERMRHDTTPERLEKIEERLTRLEQMKAGNT